MKRVLITNRQYVAAQQFAGAASWKYPYKYKSIQIHNIAIVHCVDYLALINENKELAPGDEIVIKNGDPEIIDALLPKTVRTRNGKMIKYDQILAIIGR